MQDKIEYMMIDARTLVLWLITDQYVRSVSLSHCSDLVVLLQICKF
jgi:hypothetical protein